MLSKGFIRLADGKDEKDTAQVIEGFGTLSVHGIYLLNITTSVSPKIESEPFGTLCKQILFRINHSLSHAALLPHTNVHHYFYNSCCIRYGSYPLAFRLIEINTMLG